MKGLRNVLVTAAAILVLSAGVLLAYEVPKEITIKRPAKNKPLAQWVGPVKFPHGLHAVWNACQDCHHKESAKNLGEFLSCTQCHNEDNPNVNTGFYQAWHNSSPHSCMGCHRLKRLDKTLKKNMPPLSCTNGCHKKE